MTACTAVAAVLIVAGLWECGVAWAQLLGLAESHHGFYRVTGTFYNPGPFCCFLAMIMPIALCHTLAGRRGALKVAASVYLVASMAIMPVLMGRTGWIAAAVGCCVTLRGCGRIKPLRPAAKFAAVIIPAIALALMVWMKPESALGRLLLWRVGVSAALAHPFSGVGWEQVAGAIGAAQESYFHANPDSMMASVAGTPEYAFNEYLQVAIAFGIPAMLAFIAVLIFAGVSAWRGGDYGIAGSVVAFAIACLSSYPLQFLLFTAGAAILIAGAIVAAPRMNRGLQAVMCLAVAAGAVILCLTQWRHTDYSVATAGRRILAGGLDGAAIKTLDSIAAGGRPTAAFLFDYGKALREAGFYEKSTAIMLRGVELSSDPMFLIVAGRNSQDMGRPDSAARFYRRAIDRVPSRMYPHYLLARLYADSAAGDPAMFQEAYMKVMTLKPKVMSPAVRQMREELERLRSEQRE